MRQPRRAWTRTAKKKVKKAFVRGVPDARIHMFSMGNQKKMAEYDLVGDLIVGEDCQVRDNALEAARIAANKVFEKAILLENYFFQVRVYPHQCLREHSMLTGAGADRLSDGMRLSFGRPSGRAAAVCEGQKIFTVWSYKKYKDQMKEGLDRAARKMPGRCRIEIGGKKNGH
jgi:large subunit ribosomal protein L10e